MSAMKRPAKARSHVHWYYLVFLLLAVMYFREFVRFDGIRKRILMDSIEGTALQKAALSTLTQMGTPPYPTTNSTTSSLTTDFEVERRTATTTEHESTEDENPTSSTSASDVGDPEPAATAKALTEHEPTQDETPTAATPASDINDTQPTATATANATPTTQDKPRGVFVLKTIRGHDVLRTICTLDKFFNNGPKYAIRIFADEQVPESTIVELKKINPLVDLQVIVDEVKWKQLPDEFSPVEKEAMAGNCTIESCTTHKIYIGYVYMGYWRYRGMAYESLKGFDYFITLDGDDYLTRPWDFDPFQLLHDNNLTGFFVTDFSNYGFDDGIEETAYAVFGKSLEGRGYLNSNDTFPFFDRDGKFNHRSIYGCFFGGRLDFFRLPEFREFSRRMVKYTYDSRVDEQVVIGMGWSMLAGDRVWHLPTRGYRLGVYHQSTVDDEILVNCDSQPPPEGAPVFNNTETGVCYWSNRSIPGEVPHAFPYPEYYIEKYWVDYNDLVRSLLAARGDDVETTRNLEASWEECYCQSTKEGSWYDNQCKE